MDPFVHTVDIPSLGKVVKEDIDTILDVLVDLRILR